jgi:hypothetical protein
MWAVIAAQHLAPDNTNADRTQIWTCRGVQAQTLDDVNGNDQLERLADVLRQWERVQHMWHVVACSIPSLFRHADGTDVF